MKVLSIGTDRKLFDEKSQAYERSLGYSELMDELHLLVFTLKKEDHLYKEKGKLHIHPTNSFSQWFYVWDAYKLGKRIIKNNNLIKESSVISTQDPFQTGFVGVWLSKKFKLPLQVQIHTDFLSKYFSGFFNKIRRIIALFVIPRADSIRVVSEIIKNSLKEHYKNLRVRVDVLPVFVDVHKIFKNLETFHVPERMPEAILMVSRFTKEKRIDLGLEVFKKVFDKQKDVGLTIIGSGPEKDNLYKKRKELGFDDNEIKILDWDNDIISAYKKATIFLSTSEYEGYGMTLIEAGTVGCPIVTTEVGIAKNGLFKNDENSFVCPVGDVDCLAKAVTTLLEDSEKRKLFSQRMQDSIKSIAISREEYVTRYVGLLEKTAKKT